MGLVVTQVPVKHCQECMHAPITPSLLKWMQAITPVAPLSCCRTPQWDVSVVGKTLRVYAETQQSASLSDWLMTGTSVDWMVTQGPHHLLRHPGEHLPWILVRIAHWSEAASASLSNRPLTRTSVEWVVTEYIVCHLQCCPNELFPEFRCKAAGRGKFRKHFQSVHWPRWVEWSRLCPFYQMS